MQNLYRDRIALYIILHFIILLYIVLHFVILLYIILHFVILLYMYWGILVKCLRKLLLTFLLDLISPLVLVRKMNLNPTADVNTNGTLFSAKGCTYLNVYYVSKSRTRLFILSSVLTSLTKKTRWISQLKTRSSSKS